MRPIESLIRAPRLDASTARGAWEGSTPRAKFRGAAESDKSRKRAFGRCARR